MAAREESACRPTLWRTCRVLGNRTRLRILREVLLRPDQPVTVVAERLRLPVALASRYLRDLQARGLLLASRRLVRIEAGTFRLASPRPTLLRTLLDLAQHP